MRKLDIQGLTMSFGPLRAVDDVSLQVDEGETVVLLGRAAAERRHSCVSSPDFCAPAPARSALTDALSLPQP